ncbi:MAG: YIP1 family protein [Verrucomicrobiota bacterium]|jgi:hypothetical protein
MESTPSIPEPQPVGSCPPATSLAGRLLNIFAAPGDVFDEIKTTPPCVGSWLVPVLLSAVIGTLSVIIMFSQPAIIQQIHEQQAKVFDDQVNAGKMTRAQADQAEAAAEKFSGPTLMKISGSVGVVVISFVRVFWWAFVLWLLGLMFLKAKLNYPKAVEVAGLTTMITVLGTLVTLLLTVILGKMTSPSLALFVDHFEPNNVSHLVLADVNVFDFWLVGVMAVGLSRLAGTRFSKTLLLTAGYWLAIQLFFILLAVLIKAIFSTAKQL